MRKCKHCGGETGFFSNKHKECEEKLKSDIDRISDIFSFALHSNKAFQDIISEAELISKESFIKDLNGVIISCLISLMEKALYGKMPDSQKQKRLSQIVYSFIDRRVNLNTNKSYQQLIKYTTLFDISIGILPGKIMDFGKVPFNLYNNERLLWVFKNVELLEYRTVYKTPQKKRGILIRAAPGVYIPTGRGRRNSIKIRTAPGAYVPVGRNDSESQKEEELVKIDTGVMGVTNLQIHFVGSTREFRLRFNRIISLEEYSDAVYIERDNDIAKPQYFTIDDSWFAYNLIRLLAMEKLTVGRVINRQSICPRCSADLVLRTGSRGKFWGCSKYPTCKYTKNYK